MAEHPITLAELQGVAFQLAPEAITADAQRNRELGENLADAILDAGLTEEFYTFALQNNLVADPNNVESARAFLLARGEEQQRTGGAAGRVQFASEQALQEEQAASLRAERKLNLASFMENLRELAFGRIKDKMELLQDVDSIRDARRANAMSALIDAAPLLIPPGQKFFPGFGPGGIGDVLGGKLGANIPNLEIPRVELPLQDLVDAPLAASPEAIEAALAPVQGTIHQPRRVELPTG